MARIEKTVFISYRRTDVYTALAVYENLKNQGYDVFFDYRSISSGDFEQIITSNIRARAHFLLILTPTALDRCNEPGDWLRREIEFAIDERRNIVPLFFKGFRFAGAVRSERSRWLRFGGSVASEPLTGKLKDLSRYNGLNVHEDYFEEAMYRLRTEFLSKPLDTVLHPVSTEVRKVVQAEQLAADEALEQIENVKELVKQEHEEPVQPKAEPTPSRNKSAPSTVDVVPLRERTANKSEAPAPRAASKPKRPIQREAQSIGIPRTIDGPVNSSGLNIRLLGWIIGGVSFLALLIWGGVNVFQNQSSNTPEPTTHSQAVETQTSRPVKTNTPPTKTSTPASTENPPPAAVITATLTPELGIGSTMTGKDGMTLLHVPAGDFMMGSVEGDLDEQPVTKVSLAAYWIDQTEVTNSMYAKCVEDGSCVRPSNTIHFYENRYDDHPVAWVDWNDAIAFCSWVGRRLPTEAEWEKAAVGNDGRKYPWGNNEPTSALLYYSTSIEDTTPVGYYPDGASPYGAYDMLGNVWEWVSSMYRPYPYDSIDGREDLSIAGDRVMRGGAWFRNATNISSSTFRRGASITTNDKYLGFRCAMDASP
jgi:formylglycine-generating enzyme required for sulfatase activity